MRGARGGIPKADAVLGVAAEILFTAALGFLGSLICWAALLVAGRI